MDLPTYSPDLSSLEILWIALEDKSLYIQIVGNIRLGMSYVNGMWTILLCKYRHHKSRKLISSIDRMADWNCR